MSRPSTPRHVSDGSSPAIRAYVIPAALLAVAMTLVGLYWLSFRPGVPIPEGLFDINGEANVPALFSAGLWFGAALLALACLRRSNRERWPLGGYWPVMAALFLYLGLDEALMIHERFGAMPEGLYEFSGAFHYSWVIAGLALVAISGLVFLKFLLSLTTVNLVLLLLAASIFVSGAAGVEMMGAAYDSGGQIPGTFALGLNWRRANALEEGLEMLGVIVLIHVLLRFLTAPGSPFRPKASVAGQA